MVQNRKTVNVTEILLGFSTECVEVHMRKKGFASAVRLELVAVRGTPHEVGGGKPAFFQFTFDNQDASPSKTGNYSCRAPSGAAL